MKDRIKHNLKIALLGAGFLFLLGYTYYEARLVLWGPELTIFSPKDYAVVTDQLVEINGQARNISGLTINGRPIMTTPDGSFSDKLLLSNGHNTIEIKVFNKFNQENKKIINIWLKK